MEELRNEKAVTGSKTNFVLEDNFGFKVPADFSICIYWISLLFECLCLRSLTKKSCLLLVILLPDCQMFKNQN